MKLGLSRVKKFHDENTALPYTPVRLKKDGDSAIVRILVAAEPDYDGYGNALDNGKKIIQSLYIHNKFKVLPITRCAAVDSESPVPDKCPLCRVKATRTMKTYIPVVVRKEEEKGVQIIEAGREMVNNLASAIEEVPGQDCTSMDFKFKRIGEGTSTQYHVLPVIGSQRPLSETEISLRDNDDFPDMDKLMMVKSEEELEKLALDWERNSKAAKVADSEDEEPTEDKPPF